jgi:hypothetical protein
MDLVENIKRSLGWLKVATFSFQYAVGSMITAGDFTSLP